MVDAIINASNDFFNPTSKNSSNAKNLTAEKRKELSIQALAKKSPLTEIASNNKVSRKFIYQQKQIGNKALDMAFEPKSKDDDVIFYLPVTKKWIRQFVLALLLICHSSFRGVIEILDSLFDYQNISLGTIHNIVIAEVKKAAVINEKEDLTGILHGAKDEIFQNSKPVLVGMDVHSTYCYLLSTEKNRDETTWGVHLLDLKERGLCPIYTIADGGKGLRAGQKAAWPDIPCHGDVFHAIRDFGKLVYFIENRSISAMKKREDLEKKMISAKKQKKGHKLSKKLAFARRKEESLLDLSNDIRTLSIWMRDDILALAGPDLESRHELFDFVIEELKKWDGIYSKKIHSFCRTLHNQKENLLAFVAILKKKLSNLAKQLKIPLYLIHGLYELQGKEKTCRSYWKQREYLQKKLKNDFFKIYQSVEKVLMDTPRASSIVENLNSRLRNYFFLRRHINNNYLELLRFFLNHRRFMRSDCPERVGRSPIETLTGKKHPHWLESLGYERFIRS